MKRIIYPFFIVMLMCTGCTYSSADFTSLCGQQIDTVLNQTVSPASYTKALYSYYIEPSIGRISSTQSGNTFSYLGTKFVMNLNVSKIINSVSYQDQRNNDIDTLNTLFYLKEGTYTDYQDDSHHYKLSIYTNDQTYITLLSTDVVNFYSVSDELTSLQLAAEMMKIARTVIVQEDAVLSAYSNHDTLEYHKEKLELFHEVVPESGNVEELINESNSIGENSSGDTGQSQINNGEQD